MKKYFLRTFQTELIQTRRCCSSITSSYENILDSRPDKPIASILAARTILLFKCIISYYVMHRLCLHPFRSRLALKCGASWQLSDREPGLRFRVGEWKNLHDDLEPIDDALFAGDLWCDRHKLHRKMKPCVNAVPGPCQCSHIKIHG